MRIVRTHQRLLCSLILTMQVVGMWIAPLVASACQGMPTAADRTPMVACPMHGGNADHTMHGGSHQVIPCDCPTMNGSSSGAGDVVLISTIGDLVDASILHVSLEASDVVAPLRSSAHSLSSDPLLPPPRL